jgi:hypothetical protein
MQIEVFCRELQTVHQNQLKGGEINSKSLNKIKNHTLQDVYVEIYTIGYYSSFYSSLKDKNSANGGHLEFPSKDEEKA